MEDERDHIDAAEKRLPELGHSQKHLVFFGVFVGSEREKDRSFVGINKERGGELPGTGEAVVARHVWYIAH